ncbi:MAG: radical SAM protein [Isosphaeraceae bacterium]
MPNILLTEKCVRSCPYCFARDYMAGRVHKTLSFENLIYLLDFLETSNYKRVSYLGGEPTLHPEFVDFVLYALHRGFHVAVFTSGVISKSKITALENNLADTLSDKLSFVCNLNKPTLSSKAEIESIGQFLGAFGRLTSPGFNIYEVDFDPRFILELISQYGLRKQLRLGLAHPIPGRLNTCLTVSELPAMARRLTEFLPFLEDAGIRPQLDCGMPLCLFSDSELGTLFRLSEGNLRFSCGPAVDVGPDMNVWCCFPLSERNRRSIYDFNSLEEVIDYYKSTQKDLRPEQSGILAGCKTCRMRENDFCSGGCCAHLIRDN